MFVGVALPSRTARHAAAAFAVAALVAALVSCTSTPKKFYQSDGPPDAREGSAHLAAKLAAMPDAVPRVEPFHPWANRPYSALGRTYTPMTTDVPFKQRGTASWYGKQFHGNKTAMGERYDMFAMSAAHPTLPLPSYARVTHVKTGKQVVVRVNDRGPFLHGRVIDLSYAAAVKLGVAGGVAEVDVERITHADIQAGRTAVASASAVPRTTAPTMIAAVTVAGVAPAPPVPTTSPVASVAPSAAPSASGGPWAVQVGAFEVAANAEVLRDRVALLLSSPDAADLPEAARTPQVERAGGIYRVLLGAMADRTTAARLSTRIEALLGRDAVLYQRP